ncbi:hypothetical protein EC991_001059 [Linnemannia zychae]|nr:hypothetical protein EC991_001059 [Linnemannia zychae]
MQIGAISARDGSAGWINGQQAALPGLTEKQLLRANPLIQKLHWSGTEDATLSLDPDDFAGLKTLQDLWLENWTCTEGRLLDVLETVSRTLKRLRLGRIRGIQQENDRNGKDSGSDSTKDIMRLDRLEWLRSHGEKASVAFLAELVKHCPNLRTLELNVKEIWNFDGLASNLRTYCPLLDTLDISSPLRLLSFKTLLRNCSMAGLRTIRVTDSCNEIELVSDILHHASTLEDLQINRSNMRMDGSHFLRPLTECTNLKRFSLNSNFCWFTPDILDTLKQQRWGCRATLQELDLNFEFFGKYYKAMKADIQALEELLLKFGWEKVRRRDREDELAHVAKIQKAFELIQFQELESSLRVLILDDVAFRRS